MPKFSTCDLFLRSKQIQTYARISRTSIKTCPKSFIYFDWNVTSVSNLTKPSTLRRNNSITLQDLPQLNLLENFSAWVKKLFLSWAHHQPTSQRKFLKKGSDLLLRTKNKNMEEYWEVANDAVAVVATHHWKRLPKNSDGERISNSGGPKLSGFSILQSLRFISFLNTYQNSMLREMPWLGLVFVLLKFSIIAQVPHVLLNLVSWYHLILKRREK